MAEAPQACAMGDKPVTRQAMYTFLDSGIKKMESSETRATLKKDPRPGQTLIKLQRGGWDKLGIDQDLGCAQLDKVEELCPGDTELFAKRQEFVIAAQRTYLQAVEDKKPATLERVKPIPREVIIEFFDACNTKMDMPETHQAMVEHARTTKQMPNQLIIQTQRQMLEVMGFEQEHGCAMLSRIGQDFPNDQDLHRRFQMWQHKAQMTCGQAMKEAGVAGGQPSMPMKIPNPFENDPDFEAMQGTAKEQLSSMSPEERGKFMQGMQQKMQSIMSMPAEGRLEHIKGLPKDSKLEFIKFQVLAMSMMQQQGGKGGHQCGHGGYGGGGQPPPGTAVSSPAQQEMM